MDTYPGQFVNEAVRGGIHGDLELRCLDDVRAGQRDPQRIQLD